VNHSEPLPPDTHVSTNVAIGLRLREERSRIRLTQAEAATLLRVSKTTQYHYEAGERSPDVSYLSLCDAAGLDFLYIVTGRKGNRSQADDRFALIKRYDISASAGPGALPGDEQPIGELAFSRQWLKQRNLREEQLLIMSVSGDSMATKLFDGDLVLVNKAETTPRSGLAYVLRQYDELVVKYVQTIGLGILRVSSENPAHPSYDIKMTDNTDVAVIGRVICSNREW
jgi:transcriptional regulator with XRE-family HTH domain